MRILTWCILALWHVGDVLAQEPVDCPTCVEDVVVETHDGAWIGGYIYWSRPPFRYLDLKKPGDRLRLQRHGRVEDEVRIWVDAVSVSRDHWPDVLGEPPPLPPAPPGNAVGGEERGGASGGGAKVGLCLRHSPHLSAHRFGAPAVEVTRQRLLELVETSLPFQPRGGSECLGCPMTVEDVTLILKSGEWVSGLMSWHVATWLRGYDLRTETPTPGEWGAGDLNEPLEIWLETVSGPRRRFETSAYFDRERQLMRGRAFPRVPGAVLLTGEPRRIDLDDIAFLLPGPSRPTYPLHVDRTVARRLLLEEPTFFLSFSRDVADASCLAFGFEEEDVQALRRLANICGKLDPEGSLAPMKETMSSSCSPPGGLG